MKKISILVGSLVCGALSDIALEITNLQIFVWLEVISVFVFVFAICFFAFRIEEK